MKIIVAQILFLSAFGIAHAEQRGSACAGMKSADVLGKILVVKNLIPESSDDSNSQRRGCCSHHHGQCGCSDGQVICCDGTASPTCGC